MLTENVLVLVLVALPLVAPPPVVLLLLSASPLVAVCVFVFDTMTQLLFVTCVLVVVTARTLLLESGPVFELVPVLLPPELLDEVDGIVFLIVTDAFNALAFVALPLVALPPVVL
jgi:hypothetical protein